ncbi:hypothetical protein [Bacillus sp. mrc49]|uniref:hypothetical protein n=1 Tax=Bacillus sp. mrc49 TaxID=2054913 RepID=UPI000C26FA3F|nr:hypothetical protein [Bacillus sp. mrc49]PJN91554.1 hypothetical protein CVN76_04285 [Bacillus sp. mrc49]
MKKKTSLGLVLSAVLSVNLFSGAFTVQASNNELVDEAKLESSIDNVINDISKEVTVEDYGINS